MDNLDNFCKVLNGTCVLPGSALEFGMVHLKRTPPQYIHLAGLLDVFKAKQVYIRITLTNFCRLFVYYRLLKYSIRYLCFTWLSQSLVWSTSNVHHRNTVT